jgi:NTE family protein
MSHDRVLVLGGGGVAGIAWETGVLAGLSDAPHGISPAQLVDAANLIIGTSAGAVVATQLATGCDIDALYAAQLAGAVPEIEPVPGEVVGGAARRAVIAARLPRHEWPSNTKLKIIAVDLETGQRAVFDRDSGVDLVDAVAASCAVPGAWPPVLINGRHYVDGGVQSATNADLAAGCARLLVVAPLTGDASLFETLTEELTLAELTGLVLHAEPAPFGTNPLSPASRGPAASAGRALGRARAGEVARLWACATNQPSTE